ncbi:MAG: endolytic transglycosylase MltG [Ruminococcus sp.]|uniref:endolytic transglycosylase MltG n=1 Tax=Ruminococcus sp. TaxID=41978 RepID=UPI0025FCA822|nr:endolytic transglycosylase MltG [Ruminococcus sp.]MCR4795211.1 endolytic transglycosylase MltG [Ruminococcus sp.]
MADNKNTDDVINDILNQLDQAKKAVEAEAAQKQSEDIKEEIKEETKQDIPVKKTVSHVKAPEMPVRNVPTERKQAPEPQRTERPVPPPVMQEAVPQRNSAAIKRNNAHHKKKKKKRSRLPGVLILTVFIFAVSICLSLVIIAFGRDMFGIGKSDNTKLIIVPENATTKEISELLYDEGIINSPKCFQLFTKFRKTTDVYLAGEHFVSPSMAYETIIKRLTSVEKDAKKEAVSVTFTEGITLYDAADMLEEEGVCKADDFIFNFNAAGYSFRFENYLPKEPDPLKFTETRMEGYLFPDTYTFTKDMDPEQVCQKIYYNFNEKMTDERLEKMSKLNLTLDKLITFASIVQKETYNQEDMNHVAGVFWNRLEKTEETAGKLQSDPTTNYSELIRSHMEVINKDIVKAYDTYQSEGLPPGAICNPGIEAIDAVLEKMKTDDFYFIANIYTRVTYFSVTYDEHLQKQAQVQADQEAEKERREAEAAAAAAAEENYE